MFIGEYSHTIDAKKRLALPSKFRGDLGGTVVITRGLDRCLFVYPVGIWETLASKLGNLPIGESGSRSFVRLMLSGAHAIEIDKQGRVVLPDYLKEYAVIKKDVIVTGVFDRLEIWDASVWSLYRTEAEKNSEEIASQLGKLGLY